MFDEGSLAGTRPVLVVEQVSEAGGGEARNAGPDDDRADTEDSATNNGVGGGIGNQERSGEMPFTCSVMA